MKQFFAILAAVCLLSIGNAFADGIGPGGSSWSSGDQTGNLTTHVFCLPSVTDGTVNVNLGHYFTGQSNITAFNGTEGHVLTWYLTGPTPGGGVSYIINGTGTATDLTQGSVTSVTDIPDANSTGSKLDGDWYVTNLSNIVCTEDDQSTPITFTATKLITGSNPGTAEFDLTLTVQVNV
jgi:hypothetical protein